MARGPDDSSLGRRAARPRRTDSFSIVLLLLGMSVGCASGKVAPRASARPPELRLGLFLDGQFLGVNPNRFALYDTGLVIFARTSSRDIVEFFSVELSPEEVMKLFDELRVQELRTLPEFGMLCCDLPVYSIAVFDSATDALGIWAFTGVLSEQGRHLERDAAVPKAFARTYERLDSYSHPRERPWFPEYVRVHVSEAKPGPTCAWPNGWEDLNSEGSVRRPLGERIGGDLGTIRARGNRLVEVQRFLVECRQRIGELRVLLDGRPVWMSMNFNLPHEWR